MAISGSLQSNNFYYFSIFAKCGVPIITLLMFNLGDISSYNQDVPTHVDRTNISTDGIQLVCLASTRTTLESYGSQNRAGQETYIKLPHIWTTSHLIGYTTRLSVPMKYDKVGFSLAFNSSAVSANTMWITDNSSQVSVMGENCTDCEVVGSYNCSSLKLKNHNASYKNFVHDTCGKPQGKKKRKFIRITAFSLCVVLIVFLFLVVLFTFLRKNKKPTHENDETVRERSTETFELCSPRPFSFEELSQATNNFRQEWILGVGGFGAVYKAILPNGKTVAVKRVSNTSQQGIKEYKAEVTIISRSNHRNLVRLIGWCHEREGEFLVVYELLENKSLDFHLFNSKMASLAWEVRYKIAQGLAKALRYLHEECGQRCVLHMDIKSSNVLLDSKFEPKLSDFGLARLIDHDRSMEVSVLAGTRGYLAPECVLTGKVSKQSDVYSYGVVALELATGKKTIDLEAEQDQKVLVKWVQNLYKMDRILEAVDPKLGDDYDELQMKGLITIGLWCVLHDFHKRPSMKEIVRVLDNTQDPLSGIHKKIPCLVHDSDPHSFNSILETCSTTSDLIVELEMDTPSPIELVGDMTTLPEPEDHTYSPLFVLRHLSLLRLLRYLIGITWFRSSNQG